MSIDLDPWYVARQLMTDALENDLLGSAGEVLTEAPLNRIVAGVLHPRGTEPVDQTSVAHGETEVSSSADDITESPVALSHVKAPSSMGLTFAVDSSQSPEVRIYLSATRYERTVIESPTSSGEDVMTRGTSSSLGEEWRPTLVQPHTPWSVSMSHTRSETTDVADGLEARAVVRRDDNGVVRVTVVVINTQTHSVGMKDDKCWFRPRIVVELGSGEFIDRRPISNLNVDDIDYATNELLYRSVKNLAVGHGCAVTWSQGERITKIETTFMPNHELALAEPAGGPYVLNMHELGQGEGMDALGDMLQDYRIWIKRTAAEIELLSGEYRETAVQHISRARLAADRIEEGIDLLNADGDALRAFQLMNRAMNEQRIRQERIRQSDPALIVPPQTWRAFQMAFILINLPGLSDSAHPDRETVDLLWFPTGGGKTEAYLGAMAFTILLRRMKVQSNAGVSVLMRYTLRLLTLQQFERAATLVCALELIRREELPRSGKIGLGLWVGMDATPNKVSDADKILKKLRLGEKVEKSNPRQLVRCPWCGSHLGYDDYLVSSAKDKLTVRCSDPTCDFSNGLPVHMTDEDVYRERPSIVIGTVDKFAMMAWNASVSALLSTDGANSPPDLIVQDELHLISGPLGTMVGLYESVVDMACTGAGRPKVIASTATIRRAEKQVRAVFDRAAEQFPPPGLDARDTYFSKESDPSAKGTRQYVGVLAPGVSQSTLIVRSYAALLDAANRLEATDDVKDAYWTLLGYFNSLRVLGGAYLQVVDDVPDRMRVLAKRRNEPPRRLSGEPDELTSRKRSSDIPIAMKALETSYPSADTPDVVLATNMISVGLDVDRLGLMVVTGQPQSSAEYIQATSRVGRRHPGLVVVLYNAARSRDKSHYESFTSYHRALYREVEATTATPFAPRARDRGAHGILVSAARLLIKGLRSDDAASDVRSYKVEVLDLVGRLVARARSVAPDQADAFEKQLETLVDQWIVGAGSDVTPVKAYPGWRERIGKLLVPAGGDEGESETMEFPVSDAPWPTLTSMRDVDATTSLIEKRRRVRRA